MKLFLTKQDDKNFASNFQRVNREKNINMHVQISPTVQASDAGVVENLDETIEIHLSNHGFVAGDDG